MELEPYEITTQTHPDIGLSDYSGDQILNTFGELKH